MIKKNKLPASDLLSEKQFVLRPSSNPDLWFPVKY